MAFLTSPEREGTALRVTIDYDYPTTALTRLLGAVFGRMYAGWCTRQMVGDAGAVQVR